MNKENSKRINMIVQSGIQKNYINLPSTKQIERIGRVCFDQIHDNGYEDRGIL